MGSRLNEEALVVSRLECHCFPHLCPSDVGETGRSDTHEIEVKHIYLWALLTHTHSVKMI